MLEQNNNNNKLSKNFNIHMITYTMKVILDAINYLTDTYYLTVLQQMRKRLISKLNGTAV